MGEKSDLRATIRGCRERIGMIETDITGMGNANKTLSRHIETLRLQKTAANDYDVTVNDTWKKDLCDNAITGQVAVVNGIDSAISTCATTISELNTCVTNAQDEITGLKNKISSCESRIAEIERAEAAAAAAAAAARAAAAAKAAAGV
jgi:prefoldin subunit 5